MTLARTPRLGFRVLGPATSRRRLIDFDAAFAAYSECDSKAEVDRETYLSAFTFGEDFRRHLDETGSTPDYEGPCWAPWIWFDLDGEALDATLKDARKRAVSILERYRTLDDDALLLFFSGSKGAHVGLPVTWVPTPSVTFHRTARHFAEALAVAGGVDIDTGVYDKVRLFRAPNSRHPRSGLHKRWLTLDELLYLGADRIQELAAKPEPFALPIVTVADPQVVADWQAALHAVEKEAEGKAQRQQAVSNGTPRMNRPTLDFIRNGADQGDRHRLLFSAAANLAEFGCPPSLAHALLTETALDSGLTPSEVRRQIDCGLKQSDTAATPSENRPLADSPSAATDALRQPADLQAQLAAHWAAPASVAAAPAGDDDAVELARERKAIQTEGGQLWTPEESGPYGIEGGRR